MTSAPNDQNRLSSEISVTLYGATEHDVDPEGRTGHDVDPESQTGHDVDPECQTGVVNSFIANVTEKLDDIVEGAQHVVENVQEVAENVAGNVHEVAMHMKEAIVEEAQDVVENFVETVQEADGGEMYFLDMGLTRNLSILPVDVAHATSTSLPHSEIEEAPLVWIEKQEEFNAQQKDPSSRTVPPMAYFLLATAVVSLSGIGPLLKVQQDATAPMKLLWRMVGTAVVLTPFALKDISAHGFPSLGKPQWLTFFLGTLFYDTMCLGFVLALDYTAVGNAVILSNSQALLMLIGKLFVGDSVTLMEGGGALIAFLGAAICSKGSSEGSEGGGMGSLFGDFLSIVSAAGGVGYIMMANSSRQHMTLFVFMWLTMSVGSLLILVFQILTDEAVTFDFNRETGVFSFFDWQPDRLPLELLIVVVCNLFGTMGYVRAMQYFSDLVISTAGLMEPVVAELLAFSFGVSALPSWKGWVGNALVAGGTFLVVCASQRGKGTRKS